MVALNLEQTTLNNSLYVYVTSVLFTLMDVLSFSESRGRDARNNCGNGGRRSFKPRS